MPRLAYVLSAILALQVAGAIALAVTGPDYGAFKASTPLVAFNTDDVDEIAIDETGGKSVDLKKQKDGWIVPALQDFPADAKKITDLMDKLHGLKRGLPVATSADALTRFKVTDDNHERRIVLKKDGKAVGEVLMGSSSSYREVHVRTPADDAVYDVAYEIYEASAKPEDWMDRDYLKVAKDDITRIELPSLVLVRDKDKGLVVEGLADGEETVKDKVDNVVDKLAKPIFSTIEGKGAEALARVADPDLTVTLKLKDDTSVIYKLKKIDKSDDWLLAASGHDYLFHVEKYAINDVVTASRDKLVKSTTASAKAGDGAPGDTAEGKKQL